MKLLILLMLIWNLIAFIMMGIDKRKAMNDKQRISEKTLLISSFLMGAVGIGAGAYVFHQILVPLALLVNIIVIYGLIRFGIV